MRFLLLCLVAACFPTGPSACDGTVVTINAHFTETDGMVEQDDCSVMTDGGAYDYAPCCPDGYSFLGISGDGSVLCEEKCGGST